VGQPVRRIFTDRARDEEFNRQGYLVMPFLSADEFGALLETSNRVETGGAKGFHATMYHGGEVNRRLAYEAITAIYQPKLDRILDQYRICVGNFMVKEPADPTSSLYTHLDWSFVDEPKHVAVHVWCPLIDVDRENGCLCVVPRSHRLVDPVRAHADIIQYREIMPTIERDYRVELPMKAGDAVFHDGRLLHGSAANRKPVRRVAAAGISVPKEATVKHAVRVSPAQVELFEVNDEFFWSYVLGERPRDVRSLGVIDYEVKQLTLEDLSRGGLVPRATETKRGEN